MRRWLWCLVLATFAGAIQAENQVVIKTNFGDITVALNQEKAPITVANFLQYVDDDSYDNTIFHRVIEDFMIQGGGFREDLSEIPDKGLIRNEADNGLKNLKGTIAMARSDEIDSASNQFFINTKDNRFLNHSKRSCTREMEAKQAERRAQGRYRPLTCKSFGYAVFGEVVSGMDVVEVIEQAETSPVGDFEDLPVTSIFIYSIERVKQEDS